jgi:hypothetical protein
VSKAEELYIFRISSSWQFRNLHMRDISISLWATFSFIIDPMFRCFRSIFFIVCVFLDELEVIFIFDERGINKGKAIGQNS